VKPRIFTPEKTMFLLIDVQEKLFPAIANGEALRGNLHRLAEAMKHLSIPTLLTEQYTKGLGDTLSALKAIVTSTTSHRTFEKTSFSCCGEEGFLELLDSMNRPQIVLCGIETHICVLSTTMGLLERGFDVAVAADATGSRNPEHHQLALDAMRQCGALVVPVETIVYQLVGKSGTDLFKRILPLFK
jgi:nicotinamidase-related amidase